MVDVVLPSKSALAGKAKAQRPGSLIKKGQTLTNDFNTYIATAIENIRNRSDINEIIRALMREDGIFSSAANSMVALAGNSGYRIAGYDSSGAMSTEVMAMAYSIFDRISLLHDYSKGYNDKPGVNSLIATLQTDVVGSGGCGVELVLDKTFAPERLVPVGYSTITWVSDGAGGRYPAQMKGQLPLNYPNIFIAEHNRNADEAYAVSLLRPGLAHTIAFNEFIEDTHRAVNRTGHSRLIATLIAEKVWASAPESVKADPEKRAAYFNSTRESIQDALSNLDPEDALVSYDTVEYEIKDTGGNKADYSSLLTTLGNLLGASLKTPATVSGLRASGGQGLSNAETLIYLKVVEAVRAPVEEVLSRALTLAVRLLGVDGYVAFEFLPVNLRPDEELEAYKGTKQNRILTLLSHGLITDADACYELGIRPQGLITNFSGTGFLDKQVDVQVAPDRVTSSGRALTPDTTANPSGRNTNAK